MSFSLNLPPVTCPRAKIRHPILDAAVKQVLYMRSIGTHQPELGELCVFRCPTCEAWHLGHSKGSVSQETLDYLERLGTDPQPGVHIRFVNQDEDRVARRRAFLFDRCPPWPSRASWETPEALPTSDHTT